MVIGRNDLCPCGSGKKYKKCCMRKDSMVEAARMREERFFQVKTDLIMRIREFLREQLPFSEQHAVKQAFDRELQSVKNKERLEYFFPVWEVKFYRYQNGLTGLEWFYQTFEEKLKKEERELIETWLTLVPRLVQIVDKTDDGVIVEDRFTGERLFMPFCETLHEAIPWGGMFSLIERLDERYYVHGLAFIEGPKGVERAYERMRQLLVETKKPYEQVAFDYFFSILDELIGEPPSGKMVKKKKVMLHYHVQDAQRFIHSLLKRNMIIIDEETDEGIELSFVGPEVKYEDNALDGPVYIREVFGYMDIEKNELSFQSMHLEKTAEFQQLMKEMNIPLIKETVKEIDVPGHVELATYAVHVEQPVPSSMGAIAQEMKLAYEQLHRPMLDGKTPMEWLEMGKKERVEQWLREREYASFTAFSSKTKPITPDYNSIRRKLKLPPSPFVWLGEERESRLYTLTPLGEQEGNAQLFNLRAFYEEKTTGKSAETKQKYKIGVTVLADYFKTKHYSSWEDVRESDWHECIVYFYLKTYRDISVNQAKRFLATCKAFTKWLDQKYGTSHAQYVWHIVKQIEERIYEAIRLLDMYHPYWERQNIGWHAIRRLTDEVKMFQVVSISSYTVTLRAVETNDLYTITTAPPLRARMKKGMFIECSLRRNENGAYAIGRIANVFPEDAVLYMN